MRAKKLIPRLLLIRERLLLGLVEKTKPLYGRFFKKSKTPWSQSLASLKKFPPKSLGKALADFLEKEKFDLMLKFESDDVYHVLFNYNTTVVDKARMQFFLVGNKKYTLYIMGTCALSLILLPEHFSTFLKEFRKGQRAISIANWDFQHLLYEPLDVLRKMIFQRTTFNPPMIFF